MKDDRHIFVFYNFLLLIFKWKQLNLLPNVAVYAIKLEVFEIGSKHILHVSADI